MATLAQMAQTSYQQGQQLEAQDESEATSNKADYTNYSNEADSANKNLQSEAAYMQGAGSGQNVYNSELGTLENSAGYNPQQLADANKTLFSLTGALNSTNAQFNTPGGVGQYGVSAPALASYESSILNPLQTGANTANTEVGALNTELGTFETGASQATGSQVQSEQNTVTALTNAVANYTNLAQNAMSQMQFYSQLASQQGNLNAQEQNSFAQAQQAYAAATQAIAQSKYLLAQTAQQNMQNQQTSAYMGSQAYQNYLKYGSTTGPSNSGGTLSVGQASPSSSILLQATGNPQKSSGGLTVQGSSGGGLQGGNVRLQ